MCLSNSRIRMFSCVVGLLIGVVSSPMTCAAGGNNNYQIYRAVVSAGPDDPANVPGGHTGLERLQHFYQRLLKEFHVQDLGDAEVGCDHCADLNGASPPKKLVFIMKASTKRAVAFAKTWEFIQQQMRNPLFEMQLNAVTDSPACPNPLPPGCGPRAICINTDYCDKPVGGSCQVCPP